MTGIDGVVGSSDSSLVVRKRVIPVVLKYNAQKLIGLQSVKSRDSGYQSIQKEMELFQQFMESRLSNGVYNGDARVWMTGEFIYHPSSMSATHYEVFRRRLDLPTGEDVRKVGAELLGELGKIMYLRWLDFESDRRKYEPNQLSSYTDDTPHRPPERITLRIETTPFPKF